ncbi:MAG: chromate transporter [Clostridiales bacterium]|nr:chromate transporter [Clostridiales bacterium]
MKKEKPTYAALFAHTFTISAFTIGGGYVMLPMMRERFVEKLHWINEDELAELTAIGQSSPGAMVVNTNVLMGYRLLGFWGAVCALLGTALPPLVILSVVFCFYDAIRGNSYVSAGFRGMRAGVSAVIADTVIDMAAPYLKREKMLYIPIMVLAFVFAWFFDVNVAVIIISCGALGAIFGILRDRRRRSS